MHFAAEVGGAKEVALVETPGGKFEIETRDHRYPLDADDGPGVIIEAEKVFIINKAEGRRTQITPDDIKRLSNLEDAGVRGGIHAKHTWLVALHDGSLWIAKKTGTEERDEIFVYLLAQKMFRGIVPETVPGYIPKIGWVSMQRKVSGIPAGRVDGLHGYMHGNDEMQADLVAMLVMDYLIGNSDRHANNWFLMHNDRLAAIDNGWAGEDVAMTLSAVFEPADLAGLVRDESLWPKMLQMMLTLIKDLTGRGDEARALAKEIAIDRKEAILMVRLWEPKLQRLARFIQTEASKLTKARTYLKPGQQAPAGTQEQEGPRGGRYYESEPVMPGFERPPEYKTEASLLDDETVGLAEQQEGIFLNALDDMGDEPELKEIKYLSMSDSQVRSAMKARITRIIAARVEGELELPSTIDERREVSEMLSSWAASSSDDNDDSIAMQLAAAELFDVRATPFIEEHYRVSYFKEHERGQAQLKRAKLIVQAMYDETQEFFKEQGIEELVLFRGMRWVTEAAPSEVQDVADALHGTRSIMPGLHTTKMAFHANPLSSWAYLPADAVSFANYKPNTEGTEYEGSGGYDFDDSYFLDQAEAALAEEAVYRDIDVNDKAAYNAWKIEYLKDKGYDSVGQWAYTDANIDPPTIEPPATRAVMVSRVPVRKILATAMTGLGCLEESEIVTLGGENIPTQIYAGMSEGEAGGLNFRDIVVAERDYVEAQTPEAQAAKRKEEEWKTWADANLEDLIKQRVAAINQAVVGIREKLTAKKAQIDELTVKMNAVPELYLYEEIATEIRQLEEQHAAIYDQATESAEEPFRIKAAQMIEEAGFEVPSVWAPRGQPDA